MVLEKMCSRNDKKFLIIFNYFPLKEGVALRVKKIETPLPNDNLCQVWLKCLPSGSGEVSNVKFSD